MERPAPEDAYMEKEQVIEAMKEIISLVPKGFYADLLYDSVAITALKRDKSGTIISTPHLRGYVFRLFNGRRYTELADPNISSLKRHVKKLLSNANKFHDVLLQQLEPKTLDVDLTENIPNNKISFEEEVRRVNQVYDRVNRMDEDLTNVNLIYRNSKIKRIFVNTEGSVLRQVIPRTGIFIRIIVKKDGKRKTNFKLYSHQGGIDLLDRCTDEDIQGMINTAKRQIHAKYAKMGRTNVILDPSLSGFLAHESLGHCVEADQCIRGRSFLFDKLGEQIGPEFLNIVDEPNHPGAFGSYIFDDEGVLSAKTYIIKKGKLKSLIHNRFTATLLNCAPHGNGRRESFLNPIYPRLSNTYIEPGTYSFEEMLESVKNGYYLTNGISGLEDPLGGYVKISSHEVWKIENGEITDILQGASVEGKILKILPSIIAISNENIKLDAALSGKGMEDFVPISSGGAHIAMKDIMLTPG